MDTRFSAYNAPRLFIGLVILAMGSVALLSGLGLINVNVDDIWRFWPLFLIAVGISRVLRPRGCPGRFTGFVLLFFGIYFLLRSFELIATRAQIILPAILLLIGGRLVWGAWRQRTDAADQGPPGDVSDRMSSFSFMGGSEHRNTSADFRGGDATAIFGSCKIDLRQAAMKSGTAVIDTFAMWGSVEIWVPRDWSISLNGMPILGSFEDKTNQVKDAPGPRLVVRGVAIMGSVEVKS
jgi:predicted membrane protein